MSKVCKLLFILFLSNFALFFYFPQTVSAESCDFKFYDASGKEIKPYQNMGDISVTVTSNDLSSGRYTATLKMPGGGSYGMFFGPNAIELTNGTGQFTIKKPGTANDWSIGTYLLLFGNRVQSDVTPSEASAYCKKVFEITEAVAQPQCIASIEQKTIDPEIGVVLTTTDIITEKYDIIINGPTERKFSNTPLSSDTRSDLGKFPTGIYTVTIKKSDRIQCNQPTFEVYPKGSTNPPPPPGTQSICDIYASLLPESKDRYTVGAGSKDLPPNQDFEVRLTNGDKEIKKPAHSNVNGLVAVNVSNDITKGNYTVKIFDTKDSLMCIKDFSIPQDVSQIQTKICGSIDKETGKKIVCTSVGFESQCDANGSRGPAIKTAIGCIHTNPAEFVKDVMTFVIGISGGLAFLLMILGAFQMLTSAGNPDTLHAGRERLTSAVIGLLIVIFATLLLQIIGLDILQIPGFKR